MSFLGVMRRVQQEAQKQGGSFVHYSQSLEPTNTLISSLPYTEDGICQALSAKWVAEHANGGSLWNWLFVPGTTWIKLANIANLMINFVESTVRTASDVDESKGNHRRRQKIARGLSNPTTRKANTGGQFYQDFVTDKYLMLYAKLIRRKIVQPGITGSMKKQVRVGSGASAGYRLADALSEKKMVSRGGSYVIISIMGDGGHAMAAFIGSDISFFDPNFGEFWFPNHAKFKAWFIQFWKISGYGDDFDKFYLMPYAKGI